MATTAAHRAGPEQVERPMTCPLCPAKCGLVVTVAGDRVVRVRGDAEHPITRGYSCVKGRALGTDFHDEIRLDQPYLRMGGELVPATWSEVLDDLAARLRDVIDEHGPQAVGAFVGGGGFSDSAGYQVADRLFAAIGTRARYSDLTIDNASKFLAAEMVAGFPGLLPGIDRDNADFVLLLGTNPVISHGYLAGHPDPINWLRAVRERGQLWVVDPRASETARLATRHLAPRPGTDYALLAHLVREILRDGADHDYLQAHASGVEELTAAVEPFDTARTAAITRLAPDALDELVAAVRGAERIAAETGTGVSMSAFAPVTEWLLWALLAAKHSLDQPGGMWFNPGWSKRLDQKRREAHPIDGLTGPGPRSRPDLAGRLGEHPSAVIPDEIDTGNLHALFAIGGNVLACLPDTNRLRASLARLSIFVVAETIHNEVTELATHLLPCTGPLERDRASVSGFGAPAVYAEYAPAVLPPAAQRKPMWWSFGELGRRLGITGLVPGDADLESLTDDDFLAPMFARGRVSFEELKAHRFHVASGPVFGWVEEMALPGGRWRLAPPLLVDRLHSMPDPAPLVLVPRRQPRHVNAQLRRRGDKPYVVIGPADAGAVGITEGDCVEITSQSGTIRAIARIEPGMHEGGVSIPHGWAEPNVNTLLSCSADLDPLTGMPHSSGTAVTLTRVSSPDQGWDGAGGASGNSKNSSSG